MCGWPRRRRRSWCRSQELARRSLRLAVPHHGHDPFRVEHGPPGLTLQAQQAVRAKLHAGQLLVLGCDEPDVAGPADHYGNRPGFADEGLEQVADRLTGHQPNTSIHRYKQDAPRRATITWRYRVAPAGGRSTHRLTTGQTATLPLLSLYWPGDMPNSRLNALTVRRRYRIRYAGRSLPR